MLRRQSRAYLRERSFLQKAFHEVEDDYDYILIDCPPNLYLMTQNALIVSDWYVVTAIPDHLSTIGLNILQRKVRSIGKTWSLLRNSLDRQDWMYPTSEESSLCASDWEEAGSQMYTAAQ
jgi:cellulose biosynthesis protein BcsQ